MDRNSSVADTPAHLSPDPEMKPLHWGRNLSEAETKI